MIIIISRGKKVQLAEIAKLLLFLHTYKRLKVAP